ncbi:hypothetical protein BASA60_000878 [Batrachochytrium salamandrivorans]|nr:hypothetical protein BASA60_000878 [Batrachochytrium salamandrivorans]
MLAPPIDQFVSRDALIEAAYGTFGKDDQWTLPCMQPQTHNHEASRDNSATLSSKTHEHARGTQEEKEQVPFGRSHEYLVIEGIAKPQVLVTDRELALMQRTQTHTFPKFTQSSLRLARAANCSGHCNVQFTGTDRRNSLRCWTGVDKSKD